MTEQETPTARTIRLIQEEERERCAKIVERRASAFAGDGAKELEHLAHCIRQGRYVSGELVK